MDETAWYFVDAGGQRQGPASASAVLAALEGGHLSRASLVWRAGMARWEPIDAVAPALGLAAAPSGPPALPPPVPPATPASPGAVVYAGFWRRWAALFIDGLVYGTPILVVAALAGVAASAARPDDRTAFIGAYYAVYFLLFLLVAPLYFALQESGRHQATLGKRALGIKVTDEHGRPLAFGRALGRWFAAALNYLSCYVGYLMVGLTARKQGLHDMVAGTLVVDRWAFTGQPELQKRGVSGCLVAVVLGVILLAVAGILAAIAVPAYQDYVVRAKVAEALAAGQPLEATVAAYRQEHAACPRNGEGGVAPAERYAGGPVAGIATGALQDSGRCAIELTLRGPPAPLAGKRVWLELDPARGEWRCSSELADRYLPARCRD